MVAVRGHGVGGQPRPPRPSPTHTGSAGGGRPRLPPVCTHAGVGGRGTAWSPLSLGQPGCAPLPGCAWGCPRLHLCDDLAVLRHVDLHGHAVRGAPQDVNRGRLRGRRSPWVPAPLPAPGQHPGVHIPGQGLRGGCLQGHSCRSRLARRAGPDCPFTPCRCAKVYGMHPSR